MELIFHPVALDTFLEEEEEDFEQLVTPPAMTAQEITTLNKCFFIIGLEFKKSILSTTLIYFDISSRL
ncbi:hypothetical protein GCM10011414_27500 [Croceivirga lutea]|nr:hypothetical protein GCM10011414_27500 [Croceivirga lutea]